MDDMSRHLSPSNTQRVHFYKMVLLVTLCTSYFIGSRLTIWDGYATIQCFSRLFVVLQSLICLYLRHFSNKQTAFPVRAPIVKKCRYYIDYDNPVLIRHFHTETASVRLLDASNPEIYWWMDRKNPSQTGNDRDRQQKTSIIVQVQMTSFSLSFIGGVQYKQTIKMLLYWTQYNLRKYTLMS